MRNVSFNEKIFSYWDIEFLLTETAQELSEKYKDFDYKTFRSRFSQKLEERIKKEEL